MTGADWAVGRDAVYEIQHGEDAEDQEFFNIDTETLMKALQQVGAGRDAQRVCRRRRLARAAAGERGQGADLCRLVARESRFAASPTAVVRALTVRAVSGVKFF